MNLFSIVWFTSVGPLFSIGTAALLEMLLVGVLLAIVKFCPTSNFDSEEIEFASWILKRQLIVFPLCGILISVIYVFLGWTVTIDGMYIVPSWSSFLVQLILAGVIGLLQVLRELRK